MPNFFRRFLGSERQEELADRDQGREERERLDKEIKNQVIGKILDFLAEFKRNPGEAKQKYRATNETEANFSNISPGRLIEITQAPITVEQLEEIMEISREQRLKKKLLVKTEEEEVWSTNIPDLQYVIKSRANGYFRIDPEVEKEIRVFNAVKRGSAPIVDQTRPETKPVISVPETNTAEEDRLTRENEEYVASLGRVKVPGPADPVWPEFKRQIDENEPDEK